MRTRADLELSVSEWRELKTFLDEAKPVFETARKQSDIEMQAPRVRADEGTEKFDPRGWVGTYPGDVTVVAEKFSADEFQKLRNDVAGWLNALGPGTANSLLPYLPKEVLDQSKTLRSYSRRLIEYTEVVMAGRPPVETEFVREQSLEPRGRPLVPQTVRERAQGTRQIISQRVKFTFETLPNLLLIRFHAELAGRLRGLANVSDEVEAMLIDRIDYHTEFTESGLPERLFETAMTTDFTSPKILAEARGLADEQVQDVIDLWEAYTENITMQTDLTRNFETSLKPISKLYELWILREILESLETVTGIEAQPTGEGLNRFTIGDKLRFRYDSSIRDHSRYLSALGSSPGRPDFALEEKNGSDWQCIWIGDAKYKDTDSSFSNGARRFLRYLVDCLPAGPSSVGTLFCAIGNDRADVNTEDYTIEFIVSRPTRRPHLQNRLQNRLSFYGI